MKQCPYCGSELKDDAKFCGECGKSLIEDGAVVEEVPENGPIDPIPAEPVVEPAEPVTAVPVAAEAPQAAPEAPVQPEPDMPVITQGEWSYPELQYDTAVCLKLTIEEALWTLEGFFGEGASICRSGTPGS